LTGAKDGMMGILAHGRGVLDRTFDSLGIHEIFGASWKKWNDRICLVVSTALCNQLTGLLGIIGLGPTAY